eukprot:363888-Chlamydomonas_euryale.AAC.6
MPQLSVRDAMKTVHHSKAAEALVMAFYVNGWAFSSHTLTNFVRNSFLRAHCSADCSCCTWLQRAYL